MAGMVATDDVVRIEQVQKVYQRDKSATPVYALREVNMVIPRGQYVAIMGPSGSGKSTLMNILGCLDKPSSGRFLLADKDVSVMSDDELSRARGKYIGFVFQAFNLITQLTILQNVEVPLFYQAVHRDLRHQRAKAALERVGLADRLHHRPTQLSGGQMQRVAIARALVNEPSLLLADEPTGNLDSATGQSILKLFAELHTQGLTIAMVTHDNSIAQRCQRVVRLCDGLVETDILRKDAPANET